MDTQKKRFQFGMVPRVAVTDPSLSSRDIHLLCLLACNADKNGHTVRSQTKMARELGWARSTVQRSIKSLIKAEWLDRIEYRRPDGGDCSHGYIIHRESKAEDCPRESTWGAEPEEQGVPTQAGSYKIKPIKTKPEKTKKTSQRDVLDVATSTSGNTHSKSLEKRPQQPAWRTYLDAVYKALLYRGINPQADHMIGGVNAILAWYSLGADLKKDIIPVLDSLPPKTRLRVYSLNYFTKAIEKSVKRRHGCGEGDTQVRQEAKARCGSEEITFPSGSSPDKGHYDISLTIPGTVSSPQHHGSGLDMSRWLTELDHRRKNRTEEADD